MIWMNRPNGGVRWSEAFSPNHCTNLYERTDDWKPNGWKEWLKFAVPDDRQRDRCRGISPYADKVLPPARYWIAAQYDGAICSEEKAKPSLAEQLGLSVEIGSKLGREAKNKFILLSIFSLY